MDILYLYMLIHEMTDVGTAGQIGADGVRPLLSGVILAGGQARRMGGQDKGLLPWRGLPLAEHVARRLREQVDQVLVSANRHPVEYAAWGEVLADDPGLEAWSGPLAGVQAALRVARHEWLLAVPCDTPRLPHDLAMRLWQGAQAVQAPLAVARAGGRRHSVCMLLHRSLAPGLRDWLLAGERKVGMWQDSVGAVEVDFGADDSAFANINTPDELAAADDPDQGA